MIFKLLQDCVVWFEVVGSSCELVCSCPAVRPDPPVGLNWTLMNVSLTTTHFDIMLSWAPPRSADVETGWMALQYDVQYRQVGSERWEQVGPPRASLLSRSGGGPCN